jgi:hypothetical protein
MLAGFGFAAIVSAASGQEYSINGQPASVEDAVVTAARGLPFEDYWLPNSGDWGFAGSQDVQGNVYGRRPTLGERTALFDWQMAVIAPDLESIFRAFMFPRLLVAAPCGQTLGGPPRPDSLERPA